MIFLGRVTLGESRSLCSPPFWMYGLLGEGLGSKGLGLFSPPFMIQEETQRSAWSAQSPERPFQLSGILITGNFLWKLIFFPHSLF